MVTVVAKNTVKSERIERFIGLAGELIEETRKEKGCIEYSLFRDSETPNILTFIEKWESIEDLKVHFEAPHFKRIVPLFGDLVEKEGDINIYEEV